MGGNGKGKMRPEALFWGQKGRRDERAEEKAEEKAKTSSRRTMMEEMREEEARVEVEEKRKGSGREVEGKWKREVEETSFIIREEHQGRAAGRGEAEEKDEEEG
jgi:hypothetical protein